jgi:hypothetical protein
VLGSSQIICKLTLAGLNKLELVYLGKNECINQKFGEFFGASEIATISQNIPEACSFSEPETNQSFPSLSSDFYAVFSFALSLILLAPKMLLKSVKT